MVDEGYWLPGRKVLLSLYSLRATSHANDRLALKLSKEQIRNSPEINSHKPVSRQQEEKLGMYYGWPPIPTSTADLRRNAGRGYTYTGAHSADRNDQGAPCGSHGGL